MKNRLWRAIGVGALALLCFQETAWFLAPQGGAETVETGLPPWAQPSPRAWAGESKAIYLSRMDRCLPSNALSPQLSKGVWRIIPYETTDGISGSMIWAAPETGAREVTLDLPAQGWHALYVGLFHAAEAASLVWLKLDTDMASVARVSPVAFQTRFGGVEEVFFKVANLRGNRLHLSQETGESGQSCGIVYVKLIPMNDREIAGYLADRNDSSTRTLVATNDGFSDLFHRSPRTKEELLRAVELFRHTDFKTVVLEAFGADKVNYRSKYGTMKGPDFGNAPRQGDRRYIESIHALAAQGLNPDKVLIDGFHAVGMKAHVGFRPAGWSFYEPFAEFWETPFYVKNPQWRCVDRDGTVVTRMSWAVPEVRRHLIDILMERVQFGADGVNIVFNRGYPVALYEEPVVREFQARYREDPRRIEESDPRIRGLWSDVVTTFFRELRKRLDEEQERRGKGTHLEISARVLGDELDNLQYGVDVARLVSERLLDEVYTYKFDFGSRNYKDAPPPAMHENIRYDLDYFEKACGGRVPFWVGVAGGGLGLDHDLRMALSDDNTQAAGIVVQDAGWEDVYWWMVYSRMGHKNETRLR